MPYLFSLGFSHYFDSDSPGRLYVLQERVCVWKNSSFLAIVGENASGKKPSGNLDPIAENALIDRINQLAKGRGVILVTHNLAYTKHVDLVCVFEAGRIVEFAPPEELVERKGRYEGMLRTWVG